MAACAELSVDPWEWPDLAGSQIAELSSYGTHPEAPVFQYFAVRKCLAMKASIEAGDGFATLEAVYICGNAGLKMPLWLSHVFNRKYMAVVSYLALSWDAPESFGRPYPKGTNKGARAKKRRLAIQVYQEVKRLLRERPGAAVGKSLFDEVGSRLGLGATLAEEYYYSKKEYWSRSNGFDTLLEAHVVGVIAPANTKKSAGLRKRPK